MIKYGARVLRDGNISALIDNIRGLLTHSNYCKIYTDRIFLKRLMMVRIYYIYIFNLSFDKY